MQMFGNSGYKYRPEEKQLSKELFTLSPTVYDYMRNEWCFMLPSKETIEKWTDTNDVLL